MFLRIPFPRTPFFSHRSESPGVRLTVRGPYVQSCKSLVSYHIPANLAFSCDYALFCATAHHYLAYSQWLPDSFYCDGGGTPCAGESLKVYFNIDGMSWPDTANVPTFRHSAKIHATPL